MVSFLFSMLKNQAAVGLALFFTIFFGGQFLVLAPAPAQGQGATAEIANQLNAAAGSQGAGVGNYTDPRKTISLIVKILLTLVGTIFFALTVYAGYLWMTAGGNEEQVEKAKTTLRNSVLGLIIVIAAYGITLAATNLASGRGVGTNAGAGYSLEGGINSALFGGN